MSVTIDQFSAFFQELNGGREPFPWQKRLAARVHDEGWPDCIDLPTASGKTSAIDIAVFVLACQADRPTNSRMVGRRIFFTVNRRVIVDEAYARSLDLAKRLYRAEDGILKDVADALRSIAGENAPPLDAIQLRGGIYRDHAWARSITQPIVVCTTADQLGSRILFRGYGVSNSMRPVHAALAACDSLILLDEAHVTKAFSQTLRLVHKYRSMEQAGPPMHFVQMTATPTEDVSSRFTLDDADLNHATLKARQQAEKPAELVKLDKKKSVADEIVRRALAAVSDQHKAIGVIVNRVRTAREIYEAIREKYPSQTHLVIGRMRPIDRDGLQDQLRALVGPDRKETLDEPCFVIATQCLEVGADYDFDVLLTECANIDALRQRFGRLNRKGRLKAGENPFRAHGAIITNEASLVDDDPVYGAALKRTWAWLSEGGRASVDFGIAAFGELWKTVDVPTRQTLIAPAVDAAVLLPAHLDVLCQTAPGPQPEPDVSFFIHGPQRDNREVNVCWRADLRTSPDEADPRKARRHWPAVVGMLPPISTECAAVPLREVQQWLADEKAAVADADVAPAEAEEGSNGLEGARYVVIFRNGEPFPEVSNDPSAIRPNDTIIISTEDDPQPALIHIPAPVDGARELDVAEEAYAKSRRLKVVRVVEGLHPELSERVREYARSPDILVLKKSEIREDLGLAEGFRSGPDELVYPKDSGGNPTGMLFRLNSLLPREKTEWRPPDVPEDDGAGSSVESTDEVTLKVHTEHVVKRVADACDGLHLDTLRPLLIRAAELHDYGKADYRFNAMLAGLTPYEAMERPHLLAKSGRRLMSKAEFDARRERAMLPPGFRHEMLSVQIVEALAEKLLSSSIDRNLVLHLIAAHHGHARPFAPVVIDDANDETRSVAIRDWGVEITAEQRREWRDCHRLDSGVVDRFWEMTSRCGWWGLAFLESVLRLADQQASAAEEKSAHGEL